MNILLYILYTYVIYVLKPATLKQVPIIIYYTGQIT